MTTQDDEAAMMAAITKVITDLEITGPPGPVGATGATGAAGAQGVQGAPGATGAVGATGAKGDTGATGLAGATGVKGDTGATGATGATGPQGVPGAAGPAGPQGATGAAGPAGPMGAIGPAGPAGTAGSVGAIGPVGPVGATGPQGPQGSVGPSGPQGPQGATGPVGPQGPPGTTTPPAPASITDAGGDVWSFGTPAADGLNTMILKNGVGFQAASAVELALCAGIVYLKNAPVPPVLAEWFVTNPTGYTFLGQGDSFAPSPIAQTLVPGGTVVIVPVVAQVPPPPLPAVEAGVFHVRLADGDDTKDGQTTPWKTLARAAQAPAGSTVRLWGGTGNPNNTPDTFQVPSGTGFVVNGLTIGAFGAGQALIKANSCNIAVTVGANTNLLPGVKVINDGSAWCGISTAGAFVTIGCDVSGFGFEIVTNNHDVTIDGGAGRQMFVGGTTPSSADSNGIFCNPGSYNIKIRNIELAFLGGSASADPAQSGFGWHLSGIGDGGPDVPLTYTNGVPNNALCEIGPNVYVHDIGGNITGNGSGANSGGEVGQGRRIWIHGESGAPVIFKNVKPLGSFRGFDQVGLDVADGGAEWVLAERVISIGDFGGAFITYCAGPSGVWGPATIRYCLAINSGYAVGNDGNFSLQGNGNSGVQNAYNNTIIQVMGGGTLGSEYNVRFYQMSVSNGVFANNAVVTLPNYYAIYADQTPGPGFTTTHNGWFGAGAGFNWAGQVYQTLAAWAAQPNAEVNGLSSDPMFVGTAGSETPSDYALQAGSPYRGSGIDLSQAPYNFDLGTTDLLGHPVQPGTKPHRGAHAFS